MALSHNQVSVGTAATEIVSAVPTEHRSVWLHVISGGQSVFVGGSTVSTSDGFEVEAGNTERFDLEPGEPLFGIVAATTQTVSYFAA